MGCFGKRRKETEILQEHKFAYINLADFRSKSVVNWIAYIGIYAGVVISFVRYAADVYTAVVLLAFNRWTNSLEQQAILDFDIAKWIFCGCIFLSFILIGLEWVRAIKVIRTDGVAVSYMNAIAVRYNCIRGGHGKEDTGWRRFLVFSRLTKSRGFVDYIALLTYFAFHGWVRVIFAEGPRVVINTLTFISVTRVDKYVQDSNNALSFAEKFFKGFESIYNEDKVQVIVLCTMAFTTIMWVFSIIRLFLAAVLYICFLWHAMGGTSLHDYCKDRIDTRMGEIVKKKHDKALAKEKKNKENFLRQPTIPLLAADPSPKKDSDAISMSSSSYLISNQPSPPQSTIYTSSNLKREPTLPNISELERGVQAPPPTRKPSHRQLQTPYDSYGQLIDAYRDGPTETSTPLSAAPPYSLEPLPSGNGRTTFVADRIARDQYQGPSHGPPLRSLTNPSTPWASNPNLPNSQNSSPINPRFPPRGPPPHQHQGWGGPPPPRSQTAMSHPSQGPVSRVGTAPPMMRGPPPRQQQRGPPMRNFDNNGHGGGGYDEGWGYSGNGGYQDEQAQSPPRKHRGQDGYSVAPPPRAATAGPSRGGALGMYGPPPGPRSASARPPQDGPYGGIGRMGGGNGGPSMV